MAGGSCVVVVALVVALRLEAAGGGRQRGIGAWRACVLAAWDTGRARRTEGADLLLVPPVVVMNGWWCCWWWGLRWDGVSGGSTSGEQGEVSIIAAVGGRRSRPTCCCGAATTVLCQGPCLVAWVALGGAGGGKSGGRSGKGHGGDDPHRHLHPLTELAGHDSGAASAKRQQAS